jgi:hypothetical protein
MCTLFKSNHTTAIVSISENRPSTFSFTNSNEQSMISEFNLNDPPKYKDIIILNEKQHITTTTTTGHPIISAASITRNGNNDVSITPVLPLTFQQQDDNFLPKYEDLRNYA